MSAKKPATAVDRRSQQAIDAFEKAMKALGKHDYERAREHFDTLLTGFPEERDLLERARSYRAVCERALEKRPTFRPKTFDEMLHHGVYLHNRGEYEEALKFLRQAAEIHPRNEHVLYCMAATAARAGTARPRSSRCARRSRPGRPTAPRPARIPTSTPCAKTRSSCRSSIRRRRSYSGGAASPGGWPPLRPSG